MASKGGLNFKFSPKDARFLPLLAILVIGAAFTPSILGRYQEVQIKEEEVAEKRREVEDLRRQLAEVNALRQQLSHLEREYATISWPPDPRSQGAAWMVSLLEGVGLKVESIDISGGDPFAEGLLSVNVSIRGRTPSYGAVREGLEKLLASRSVIRSVRLEYDAKQGLTFDLQVGVLVPQIGAMGGGP